MMLGDAVIAMNIFEFYNKFQKFVSDDSDDDVVSAINDISFTIGKSKLNIDVLYSIISYLYIDTLGKQRFERICNERFHTLDERGIRYVVII